MKKLGLIGGTSWVSTLDYYRMINEGVNAKLGGLNYAECMIYSFNYDVIKRNNDADDWDANFILIGAAGEHLKNAGAEGIVLCANTMHIIADRVQQRLGLPLIHIATVTASAIKAAKISKVGLLGTKFTMERDFFKSKLAGQGIDTLIPETGERDFIHYTIFEELGRNEFKSSTRQRYLEIIEQMVSRGAEGIILGCTEIPMLIKAEEVPVPSFDTTMLHAQAAVEFAVG